jgi:hypothetical protein
MRIENEAKTLEDGAVDPAHVIHQVCADCGYDLDEAELAADTCADCGAALNLKQHIAISVTTFPPVLAETS